MKHKTIVLMMASQQASKLNKNKELDQTMGES